MKLIIENLDTNKPGITNTYFYLTSTTFEERRATSKYKLRNLPSESQSKVKIGISQQ